MKTRNSVVRCVLFATLLSGCHSLRPRADAAEPAVLPLRSVRLYENGVGYFEREGVLADAGGTVLGVPASHVDDALKTMLVLSSGDAKLGGIEFSSVVSDGAARSLAGLPLDGKSPIDYTHLLESLKGFRIDVVGKNGSLVRGRLLDVETPSAQDHILVVVAEDGALVRVRSGDATQIRPLDPEFSARLQTAADALGGRAAQLGRELRVLARANAPIRIGYIAETPLWRSTYRLVLPPDGTRAELQGWALVHNDTDERWQDVHVTLVNGSPDSFLFPLAAPRYARRSLSTPETELSTVPQLALRTADALWGDHVDDEISAGGIGLMGYGSGGGGAGGIGLGHGRSVRSPKVRPGRTSDVLAIGDLAKAAAARGKDEGQLYSYRLAEAVSLRPHGSALLPLLSHSVDTRRLTRFESAGAGRAALRLRNDSPYVLPAGPLSVFEPAGFSGEAVLERLVPGASVFLEYGEDPDATLDVVAHPVSTSTALVTWDENKRSLSEHYVQVTERTLTVHNRARTPRTVAYVLSDVVENAKVEGAIEVDYDEARHAALAMIAAPAGQTQRTLRITEGRVTTTDVDSLSEEVVRHLLASEQLPAAQRTALAAVLPHVVTMSRARDAVSSLEEKQSVINDDIERNQGHLAAVQGPAGAANPLALRVVALEGALERNRKDLEAANARLEDATHVVERFLQALVRSSG